jgi:hypothetical protein
MATPTTSREFRDRAAECEHMAEEATNAEDHERMLYIAARWRSLADEDESEEELPLLEPKSKARPHTQCRGIFHGGAVGGCTGLRGHQYIPDANFRWVCEHGRLGVVPHAGVERPCAGGYAQPISTSTALLTFW